MAKHKPSFFARIFLVFGVAVRFLFSGAFAARVQRLTRENGIADESAPERTSPVTKLQESLPDSALQLLGLLQQEGRFIDFMQESVEDFTDAQVGAAARVVHEGCRKALREHFTIEPIRDEAEGKLITIEPGFDAGAIRVIGNVVGDPPFTGTLVHRGWHATEVKLPKVAEGHDVGVLANAEVEL